jgi:2-phosphosulfolactate phosphatase
MTFSQSEFDIRCEWGEHGVSQLAPISDVVIIVDVLSFSTSVEIATSHDAMIFPYRWKDASAAVFAASVGAIVANARRGSLGYSLSPQSLVHLPQGTRLVMPSPNGATLTLGADKVPTLAGCLRNAQAVAAVAQSYGKRIAVIPAGERWLSDGGLRPAFEDWVGAGAIISHLAGARSPEAHAAATTFLGVQSDLAGLLKSCGSGRELIARGFASDVALASTLNISTCVPVFRGGAYVQWGYQRPRILPKSGAADKGIGSMPYSLRSASYCSCLASAIGRGPPPALGVSSPKALAGSLNDLNQKGGIVLGPRPVGDLQLVA